MGIGGAERGKEEVRTQSSEGEQWRKKEAEEARCRRDQKRGAKRGEGVSGREEAV